MTAPASLRAYRVACPVCHVAPRHVCTGVPTGTVHAERAKAAKR